jgi:ribose-phosphate pyrophosphokinase
MMPHDFLLFAGSANPALAHAVAAELDAPLAACDIARFPDGEVSVTLGTSVRGRDVLLVQPTSPPVNDHLVELLAFADACRRASASSLTAIVPYFGYARSDRRQGLRVPVTGSLVASLMEAAGVAHVVVLDVHSSQLEGFFRIPVDNLTAVPALATALEEHADPEMVVVAPDLGAVKLATAYGRRLYLPVAAVHKLRRSPTEVTSGGVTGDVEGRRCIIVDDMITTGATIEGAIAAVRAAGAREEVVVAATHGVLTDGAWDRLDRAGVRELWLGDSVPLAPRARPRTHVVSVAPVIAAAIAHAARDRFDEAHELAGAG